MRHLDGAIARARDRIGGKERLELRDLLLAQGDGAAICATAKASDLRGAFTKLTAAEARAA